MTGQGDDYTTSFPLYYNYFNKQYKILAIDLRKPKSLDADPKAIEHINFTWNRNRGQNENDNTAMLFVIEEAKEPILDFSQGTVKVL